MYNKLKRFLYRRLIPFIKVIKYLEWISYITFQKNISLIIGSGPTKYKGWFPTDLDTLDVTNVSDFEKYFRRKKINKILAEHVLEHLSDQEIEKMLNNIYKYSDNELIFRVAVPDGFHINNEYIKKVKPGGTGEGAKDHKHLFNFKTLTDKIEKFGFQAKLVEYWDEQGQFHSSYTDKNGYIKRSLKNDKRNIDGKPNYTSLIIDFYKK